jgi:hypothetical protein
MSENEGEGESLMKLGGDSVEIEGKLEKLENAEENSVKAR